MFEMAYQISPDDYVHAQYLHMRPRAWAKWLGVVIGALFLIAVAIDISSMARRESSGWSLLIPIALVAVFAGYFWWIVPAGARRRWREQKGLHEPIRVRMSDDGVLFQSPRGQVLTPWNHFLKWRESRHIFLLYISRNLFHMLPKRGLSPQDIDGLRGVFADKVRAA